MELIRQIHFGTSGVPLLESVERFLLSLFPSSRIYSTAKSKGLSWRSTTDKSMHFILIYCLSRLLFPRARDTALLRNSVFFCWYEKRRVLRRSRGRLQFFIYADFLASLSRWDRPKSGGCIEWNPILDRRNSRAFGADVVHLPSSWLIHCGRKSVWLRTHLDGGTSLSLPPNE